MQRRDVNTIQIKLWTSQLISTFYLPDNAATNLGSISINRCPLDLS
jgi:hypothetical protein